ncbi:MAG: UPF0175 family protein [SAR324 cluster bacterium]|nr:UPF0175 family protein [SAR324 cluster bacterium]
MNMETQSLNQFEEILDSLGGQSAEFFLAASLYHAHKVSFHRASELAGLSFMDFQARLKEHFAGGFILAEDVVQSDIYQVDQWMEQNG